MLPTLLCSPPQHLLVDGALYIGRMEELVSLVAAGLLQILIVQGLYVLVEVGQTQGLCRILGIQSLCTLSTQVGEVADRCRLDRLTAAVDAAARASHDLDEVYLLLAVLNAGQELPWHLPDRKQLQP